MDALRILTRSPLFEELSPSDLEPLALQAHIRSFSKGETLFFQGDRVQFLYVVASGLVKIYRPDPKGLRQVVLHLEGPHMLVAAVAMFLEKPFYPASAETLEDSTLLAIPRDAFFNLVDTRPSVARALIRYLAKRQGQLVHQMDRLIFHEVGARLAEYLLGRQALEGDGFRLPTNSELAVLMTTVPEPVSRKLGQFFRQGLIDMKERRVWIKDTKALQQIAEE